MRFPRLLTIATKVVKDTLLSLPTEIRNEAGDCRIELTEMDALIDIDEDLDPDLRNPQAYADDCVRLLSAAGAEWNGRIQRVMAVQDVALPAAAGKPARIALPTL